MESVEFTGSYEESYWDFKGFKKIGIHNIGKYPATMVAPMQYELLSMIISNNRNLKNLLDPFMGSGTSLIEGHNLGLSVFGIDINPYAILLGEVKTNRYKEDELNKAIDRITNKLHKKGYIYEIHDFPNIHKWFRQDIINTLSKIRAAIIEEKNSSIRKFFWVCLSEVIYKFSNDRTSTFKLHVKPEEEISNIKNTCIDFFGEIVDENKRFLNTSLNPRVKIYSGDSSEILKDFSNGSIDIICTSPPYGDNATTVTYGQASILFLKWINFKDLQGDMSLISNYSKIDSASLGGNSSTNQFPNIETAKRYISRLSESKKAKVIKFVSDYYRVATDLTRILSKGGYMLFTVGNRRVDGIEQPLDKITQEIFLKMGLKIERTFTRNILNKKMPSKVSNVKNIGSVRSMSKETILIFKKER